MIEISDYTLTLFGSNNPFFVKYKYEIYRILTSILLSKNIAHLII